MLLEMLIKTTGIVIDLKVLKDIIREEIEEVLRSQKP